ncbi:MAG: GHKL domain-containing protein [Ruminococcaceae bacterium]|nr:GHKL domain-containing protein [Oscillospiraceae bacterium]
MELLTELLANLFDSVIGAYFVLKLNKGNVRENKLFVPVIALCFAVSTAFLFISVFSLLHTAVITAILLAYAFSIKTHTVLSSIISVVVYEVTLALSSALVFFAIGNVLKIDVSLIASGFSIPRCLLLFLCKVIIAAVLLAVIRFYSPGRRFKPIDFVLYLVSPLMAIFTVSLFFVLSLNENLEGYYGLLFALSLGMVGVNALSLLLFARHNKSEDEKHEMQIVLQLREAELRRHTDSQKIYESVRILRHDLKEQIMFAKKLFEKGEFAAAEDHIARVENMVNDNSAVVNTGNGIIDSILYSKTSMNPDIRFIVSGSVCDLNSIGDIELVSLFMNMLDNAIEATSASNEKIIELSFSYIGGFQNISCKNPIIRSALSENPELNTTKSDKTLHGYGIKSMKKAVESANGLIEFYEEDNYFICHVAIPV